jgi:glutathione S-transferase
LILEYRLEQSRAQRIVWLLEELNLKYELKTYKRGKDMLAPKELRDIHPLGKSPVIAIEGPAGGRPKVIAESSVIVEYISKHFGPQLIPREYPEGKEGVVGAESEEWCRYRFFMHYAEGSIMPPLLIALAFGRKLFLITFSF